MAHEGSRAGRGTDEQAHGDGQETPLGIDHSISPGVPCPETVLVARMNDGSYLLMSYPQREPAAFVTRDDAGPLRQAFNAAFGSHTDEGEVVVDGSLVLPAYTVEPSGNRERRW